MASTELFRSSRSWLMISAVCGYFFKPRFEPQRAFQVEIVGRLVEQQQVGLGEQGGGERHPHAPAAGEFRHRAREIGVEKPRPAEDFGRARRRAVGVDLDQPGVDLAHLLRARRFRARR